MYIIGRPDCWCFNNSQQKYQLWFNNNNTNFVSGLDPVNSVLLRAHFCLCNVTMQLYATTVAV